MIREKLEDYVTTVPDFPEAGVMFRDITTILSDADGLKLAVDTFADMLKDVDFDLGSPKKWDDPPVGSPFRGQAPNTHVGMRLDFPGFRKLLIETMASYD